MIVLRALGALLTYPHRELLEALAEIGAAIDASSELGEHHKARLRDLIGTMRRADPYDLEAGYLGLFEGSRSTSLHLFEHVHGESRERGQALVDLAAVYERAGLTLRRGELPDYLPAVLEYLSCADRATVQEMLRDCAHILRGIGERLAGRGSPYAAVLDALLDIAGEPALDWGAAPAAGEPAAQRDADWMEPPAFGPACAGGFAAPAGETPIRYMPRRRGRAGATR